MDDKRIKDDSSIKIKSAGKKATQRQVKSRVEEVKELLLKGKTRSEIQQHAAKNFSLSVRVIDEYIARATSQLREICTVDNSTALAVLLSHLHGQLNNAVDINDGKLVSKIAMDIAKLRGLGITNLNLTVEDKRELVEMTDAELNAILEGSDAGN